MQHPQGRQYWTTPEMNQPTFTTQAVTKVFFGRSTVWLRKAFSQGRIGDLEIPRREHDPRNSREFRLYDIERLAHALAASHTIDGQRLERAVQIVRLVAQQHSYIS